MNELKFYYSNEGKVISTDNIPFFFDKRDTSIIDTDEGEKEVLSFAGIILEKNKIFVSFPKHYELIDDNDYILDIQLLFDTINKHYKENKILYFTKTLNIKTNYPFNEFFEIYDYYQKYGIYHENLSEIYDGYNGNVSWKDTIKKSATVINKKGILFLPLKIKKVKRYQVLISECMSYAIDYTLQQFSLFLDMPQVGGKSLEKDLLSNKDFIIRELYSLKNKFFKDIHKKLISNLISFFEKLPGGGNYYLKHYSFSSVWEKMVNHYLNYHFEGIDDNRLIFKGNRSVVNKFEKATFYPNSANPRQNIQPDYYLDDGDTQYIFDAKYYNKIDSINYKQVAYYFFLKNISVTNEKMKRKTTYNALILPGNYAQRVHFKFKRGFNIEEPDFIIYEYYLDVRKAMESYINDD